MVRRAELEGGQDVLGELSSAPAAAATGLLLDRAYPPEPGAKERVPAADITQLPGYAPLP